ncbi:MAG TPA: hypothetical protein VK324_12930 [Tepidisphaeraceae bacterium]|nr:hypothetical protein [Tepidisphaeraceae bacterium]
MTTTLIAKFDGKVLVPSEPVDLPVGTAIRLTVVQELTVPKPKTALQRLLEIADSYPPDPDAPVDGAAQHDHYLYGTPKREDP